MVLLLVATYELMHVKIYPLQENLIFVILRTFHSIQYIMSHLVLVLIQVFIHYYFAYIYIKKCRDRKSPFLFVKLKDLVLVQILVTIKTT